MRPQGRCLAACWALKTDSEGKDSESLMAQGYA